MGSWKRAASGIALLATLVYAGNGAAAARVAARPPSQTRIAFTQNSNVYLTDGNGKHREVVTTRGNSPYSYGGGIHYSWYQWSPSGKYLLLVQNEGPRRSLLLLTSHGDPIRTLASGLSSYSFFHPSWASDRDEVAYEGASTGAGPGVVTSVYGVDLGGRSRFLRSFEGYVGCGGGGGERPSERLRRQQLQGYGAAPTLTWSTARHVAIYSSNCGGWRLSATNLQTHRTVQFGGNQYMSLSEGALSKAGNVAATAGCPGDSAPRPRTCVVLADAASGAVTKVVAQGLLPVWSPDGRFLYFVQQRDGPTFQLSTSYGNPDNLDMLVSSIWRADANGMHLVRLASEDAYALGPLYPTADGRSLFFSRVENEWNLWQHRLADSSYTQSLMDQYGPRAHVQRLDVGSRRIVTVVHTAGQPAVQP